MEITSVAEFNLHLDQPYAWPGGYPRFFILADGEPLSYDAAKAEAHQIREAIAAPGTNDQWRVVGVDINWEDKELYCAHTELRIAPAYGE